MTTMLRLGPHAVEVHLAPGAVDRLPSVLARHRLHAPVLVIDDQIADRLHDRLRRLAGDHATLITTTAHEAAKTLGHVARLADTDRVSAVDAVVSVGGGVIANLAGALAHVLGFGRPLLHIPTTLTAIVDAAISARHGLNSAAGKNTIGIRHPPTAILADPRLLATLPTEQWPEGAIEAVKAALVAGDTALASARSRTPPPARSDTTHLVAALTGLTQPIADPNRLTELLSCAIDVKARLLRGDPDETGPALALHYGHTFSRAAQSHDPDLRHGPAVAAGMLLASHIAHRLGFLTADEQTRHDAWVRNTCPAAAIRHRDIPSLLSLMNTDPAPAATTAGTVPMVLLSRLGAAHQPTPDVPVTPVHVNLLADALTHLADSDP